MLPLLRLLLLAPGCLVPATVLSLLLPLSLLALMLLLLLLWLLLLLFAAVIAAVVAAVRPYLMTHLRAPTFKAKTPMLLNMNKTNNIVQEKLCFCTFMYFNHGFSVLVVCG